MPRVMIRQTICLLLVVLMVVAAESSLPYEPMYHLRSPAHAIRNPSGPFRDAVTGTVHLFMQYNPTGDTDENVSWYHVTSEDYASWRRVNPAVAMSPGRWYNRGGMKSGTLQLNNASVPVVLFTCTEEGGFERQCIANPSRTDVAGPRTLASLDMSPLNPIITGDDVPGLISRNNFRDPTSWWEDPGKPGRWLVAFAARVHDVSGDHPHVVVFATSDPTFQDGYRYSHSLYSSAANYLAYMFESPDFFRVPNSVEHFLKLSDMEAHRDYVVYGTYASDASGNYTFLMDPARSPTLLDFGPMYASKTFTDSILGQRVLWGWTREELTASQIAEQGWSGLQNLPRYVTYDEDERQLKYSPMPELKALRRDQLFSASNLKLSDGAPLTILDSDPRYALFQEIEVTFSIPPSAFDGSAMLSSNTPEVGVMIQMNHNASKFVSVSLAMPEVNSTPTPSYAQLSNAYQILDLEVNGDEVDTCAYACVQSRMCEAWSVIREPFVNRCVLSWQSSHPTQNCSAVTGRPNVPLLQLERSLSGTIGASSRIHGRAPLASAHPAWVKLHVFVDNSVVEVFKDDGLQTLTGRVYLPDGSQRSGVALFYRNIPSSSITANVSIFSMREIWSSSPPPSATRNYTDATYELLAGLAPNLLQ